MFYSVFVDTLKVYIWLLLYNNYANYSWCRSTIINACLHKNNLNVDTLMNLQFHLSLG